MKFEETTKEFELAPKGMHIGSLYLVADLGTQEYNFNDEISRRPAVWLGFELSKTQMKEGDNAGKPFVLGQKYKVSIFERAPLAIMIKEWQGVKIAPGFSLKPLLGKPALINVVHNVNDRTDRTYANITSVAPLMDDMKAPPLFNSPVYFDLDEFDGENHSLFNILPPFIQRMIQASPEYKSKTGQASGSDMPPTTPAEAYEQDHR